jgi:hypothetical protein
MGSKTILVGDKEVEVLFSNRAIANAERIMEKGIIGVLNGFQGGGSGVFEVAVLLQTGMEAARRYNRAGGARVTLDDAYGILDEFGFTTIAAPIFEAIGAVLAADGENLEGEESPN